MADNFEIRTTTADIQPGSFINIAAGPHNATPAYELKSNQILLVVRIMGRGAVLAMKPDIGNHMSGVLETVHIGNKAAVIVDAWNDHNAVRQIVVDLHDFARTIATAEKPAFQSAIYERARRTASMLLDLLPEDLRPVLEPLPVEGADGNRLVAVRPDVLAEEIADQVIRMAGKRLALAIIAMANDQRNGR